MSPVGQERVSCPVVSGAAVVAGASYSNSKALAM